MRSFRSKPVGWRYESHRHGLAAKGIGTRLGVSRGYFVDREMVTYTPQMARRLKARMRLAEANNEESFTVDGREYNMKYAKYLLQYLEMSGMRFMAKKGLDELKSYEKLKEKHKLGGEIDTGVEKLDSSIAEVRREMDQLLPTKAERDRRDVGGLTEEDKAKAKEFFELDKKLKDLKVRRQRLIDARQYYAKKSVDGGLHVEYSPVNQAYFVMWHGQVLSIWQKKFDAEAHLKDIKSRDAVNGGYMAKKCDTAIFSTTKDEDAQTFIKRNVTAETNGDGLQQFREDVSEMGRHPMKDLDGEWEEYTSLAENKSYGKYGVPEKLSTNRMERAQQRGAALFGKVVSQANVEPLVDKKEANRTMRDITVDFLFGRRVR